MTASSTPNTDGTARLRRIQRRTAITQWLRKTHGWFGLWGATLGLIFGISGIWLNHRSVLPLPPVAQVRSNSQLALPNPAPASAQALAAWLQKALSLDAPAISVRVEPAKKVAWAEQDDAAAPMQPERWAVNFGGPQTLIQAEAWVGNRSVNIRHTDSGLIATLSNMHKGTGMSVGWILLVDTLAGSLILLSVSGLTLWILTNRRRVVGSVIFGAALMTTLGLTLSRI